MLKDMTKERQLTQLSLKSDLLYITSKLLQEIC